MRCYLYRSGHIAAVEVLDIGTDGSLIQQARAAFEKRKNEFDGFEVWDRARFIYQYPELPSKYVRAGTSPNTIRYRLYFLDEAGRLLGQYDFPADNDDAALEIAQLSFDACSDRTAQFEVWHGSRLMAAGAQPAAMVEQVVTKHQAEVLELEEQIRDSKWRVASSKRLLERLETLNAKPVAIGQ